MKNLLFLCALLLSSSSFFSQDIGLKIDNLGDSGETKMTLISANLETKPETTREGLPGVKQMYVITRKQDQHSSEILQAMTNNEGFQNVQLIIRMTNGNKIIHELENVFVRNYQTKNVSGQDPTEQFELHFQEVETTYKN